MDDSGGNELSQETTNATCSNPSQDSGWQQDSKTSARVKQFLNIIEQLPRLCSPTICGTLSQPTTKAERLSRGAETFEWSLEQKAILSPANITTDMDATGEWHNVADLNPSWRQQESEMFFSQRTIAPSPLVTPSVSALRRQPYRAQMGDLVYDENEENAIHASDDGGRETPKQIIVPRMRPLNRVQEDDDTDMEEDESSRYNDSSFRNIKNQSSNSKLMSYEFENYDESSSDSESDTHFDQGDDEETDDSQDENDDGTDHDNGCEQNNNGASMRDDQDLDGFFFSPQPLKSSQTQQRMEIFSPDTFVRTMEDESTLQSTPKTIGSQRARNKARNTNDMLE